LSIMTDFLFCVDTVFSPLSVISFQFPMRCAVCAYDYLNVEHISGLFFCLPFQNQGSDLIVCHLIAIFIFQSYIQL
jgi:hypothetical protein